MTPAFFGKNKSRNQILSDINAIMENVRVQFDLSKGDMPDPIEFARCLENFRDFGVFPSIDFGLIRRLDRLIEEDIPDIVNEGDIVASEVRLGRHKIELETKLPKNVVDQQQQPMEDEREIPNSNQVCVSYVLFLNSSLISSSASSNKLSCDKSLHLKRRVFFLNWSQLSLASFC